MKSAAGREKKAQAGGEQRSSMSPCTAQRLSFTWSLSPQRHEKSKLC